MRRISLKLATVAAVALAMLAAAGCSADDPGLLPGDDAQQILTNLDRVEELAANGECAAALESIETISTQIAALPGSVSDRLKQNLRRGVRRLSEVTATSCGAPPTETETVPETTETEPETTPEEGEEGGSTGETDSGDTGTTGETGGTGGGSRGNGNAGGGGGNRPDNRPNPPRGEGGGGGGGAGQQPNPGGGETTPDEGTDSGGISPEEQTEGEVTP